MNTASPSNQPVTRREFLKSSTAAAAALGTLDLGRCAYAAGSDIIKVGMIGCGGRNAGAAAQALTAIPARASSRCARLDRIHAKRDAIKAQQGAQVTVDDAHCFTGLDGYRRVIECSDVVLIANAAKFHPLHAMAAIRAGKHVFVEKPHGIDPGGVRLMQQACDLAREKKLCIVSGLHSRHHAGYAETVKRIQDGAIGEIISMEENFLRAPYGVTARKPGLTELQWQLSAQYRFRWLSGDDVVQSLVHNLDRTSWVLGNKVPLKCHGLGGRSSMLGPVYGDVFDHHSVVYEFENGLRVYALCRTTTGCYDRTPASSSAAGQASIKACRISGETSVAGPVRPLQVEHDRLFAAIRSGEPLNNGDYMARSTLALHSRKSTWEK